MSAQSWVTLVVGVIGFAGLIAGMVQRTLADRRAEWWLRASWAVDHVLSENGTARVVGFDVLARLQSSPLITKTEADVFLHLAHLLLRETNSDDFVAGGGHTEAEEEP
ncbi:hypothetical protein K8O93_22180 [Gordonia bronchialis]|uniref:hypothetical protein n=1 Tax=Gordonia bronchialis TaxID=2054 RepID=UPI001CC113EA|nr:hypothetical protein [Gordonia bronchialis]UAK37752.1 hypothetical protein K8O93_22180 [Gordonia bronchialis]